MSTTALPTDEGVELPIIAETLEKLDAAMTELEPAVVQYNAYADVKARLLGPGGTSTPRTTSAARATTSARSGARRQNRLEEFITHVQAKPGLSIPEYAKMMDAQPNYLYRLRDKAKAEGKVEEKEKSLFPVDPVAARAAEIAASGTS